MKHPVAFFTALLATLALSPAAHAADNKLVLTGSSTVAPLALEIGKRFEAQNPGMRVDVQTGGSTRGVADAMNGLADIGMVSRALKPAEANALTAHTIAMDGVALIVHASNPLKQLDDAQIKAIYTGQIRDWRVLGGASRPITVVSKAEGRSTLELFLHYTGLKNSQIRAQAVIGDNQQGIKTVAGNPDAIGYVSLGAAEYAAGHGVPIRLLPMGGVDATTDAVRSGRFPLSRPLNLVTRGAPSPLAARFIAFAQSLAVRGLIEAQYFVPPPR